MKNKDSVGWFNSKPFIRECHFGKGKMFNTNNYFNQSKEEIKHNHREEYITDYSDKHFTNARHNYHGI